MQPTQTCRVPGCTAELEQGYSRKYRICLAHYEMKSLELNGETCKFCQQCSKFHSIHEFDQDRRSCRSSLLRHQDRRKRHKQQVEDQLHKREKLERQHQQHQRQQQQLVKQHMYQQLAQQQQQMVQQQMAEQLQEQQRQQQQRLEQERLEQQRREQQRLEQERLEQERREQERLDQMLQQRLADLQREQQRLGQLQHELEEVQELVQHSLPADCMLEMQQQVQQLVHQRSNSLPILAKQGGSGRFSPRAPVLAPLPPLPPALAMGPVLGPRLPAAGAPAFPNPGRAASVAVLDRDLQILEGGMPDGITVPEFGDPEGLELDFCSSEDLDAALGDLPQPASSAVATVVYAEQSLSPLRPHSRSAAGGCASLHQAPSVLLINAPLASSTSIDSQSQQQRAPDGSYSTAGSSTMWQPAAVAPAASFETFPVTASDGAVLPPRLPKPRAPRPSQTGARPSSRHARRQQQQQQKPQQQQDSQQTEATMAAQPGCVPMLVDAVADPQPDTGSAADL